MHLSAAMHVLGSYSKLTVIFSRVLLSGNAPPTSVVTLHRTGRCVNAHFID